MKTISTGDIIWMDRFNELIEIMGTYHSSNRGMMVQHWSDRYPFKKNAKKSCHSDAWIIGKYGVKVGSTRKKRLR